jgi:hypothetical protein
MQVALGGALVLQAAIDLLRSLPDMLTYLGSLLGKPSDRVRGAGAMLYEPRPANV